MAFTNAQTAALIEAIKSAGKVDNAVAAFGKKVAAMREAGFKAEWLESKSERIDEVRGIVADQALTAKQREVWANADLAVKVTGKDGKRVDTERGRLVKLVNQRIARLRKALSEPAKTGAKQPGSARKLDQRIKDEIAKLRNAVIKDRDGEPSLSCDHKELLAAFDRIGDILANH